MSNTLAERLKIKLAESGLTKSHLARACGVSPASVTDWCNGKTLSIRPQYLTKAAEALGVSAAWLGYGEAANVLCRAVQTADNKIEAVDLVMVSDYGQGSDEFHDFVSTSSETEVYYPRSWFEQRKLDPEKCVRIIVRGSDMDPLLKDGDSVLVNKDYEEIVTGKIYALKFDNRVIFRYLQAKLDGNLIASTSISAEYVETITPKLMEKISVIGIAVERAGEL